MVILYSMSGIVSLLGLVLLSRAIRGRRISSNPHCAHCGFDLLGLTLDRDAQCPECGRPTIPGTPSVHEGLFKRRPVLGLAALLLIAVGVTGLAWPKVSQMPTIKNFDWYAHYPESLLLKLEAGGNKDALQALHDRLIPGELSDTGLETLIQRSLALIDDDTVAWDERWGDVLLYAFLLERMTHKDMIGYIQRSFRYELKVHEQVGFDANSIKYTIVTEELSRGTWSYTFLDELRLVRPTTSGMGSLQTGYHDRIDSLRPYEHQSDGREGGFSSGSALSMNEYAGSWVPFSRESGHSTTTLDLEPQRDEFAFVFPIRVTIYRDQAIFHEWLIEHKAHITRVDNPQYLKPYQDDQMIQELAQSLRMGPIKVPVNPHRAKKHRDLTSGVPTVMRMRSSIERNLGLLGRLVFDNGVEKIDFSLISISSVNDTSYGFFTPEPWQFGRNWLDFYTEHESFWEIARKHGTIDVIYVPDLSRGLDDAQYELVIDRQLIWHDVPVDSHEVRSVNIFESGQPDRTGVHLDSTTNPRVGESYGAGEIQARRQRLEPVPGELVED